MDAAATVSVKSLDEKGTAGLGERLQFGFRNIQSAEPCQVMDDLLPRAAVCSLPSAVSTRLSLDPLRA